jgi:hypothetical protein
VNHAPPLVVALLLASCDAPTPADEKAGPVAKAETPAEVAPTPAPEPEPEVDTALHEDYDKLCNAAQRSGAADLADPNEKIVKLADWIKAEIHHPEVVELFGSLATRVPNERGSALRDAAKKAGVDPCPMADE